ncbi:MAG: acyltransferase [Pseudomonadales bacterium]|jgi:1-acyl-sn-glycerol-3-phosphate acyltransferase|nr:acyltransferase [Pseudomonadales bacterium]
MGALRGTLLLLFVALNTVAWASATFLLAAVGLLLPVPGWRAAWRRLMNRIIDGWVSCNAVVFGALLPTRIEVRGGEGLSRDEWYLVISNHRAWTDILVLQWVFRHRVPALKFFTKQQLLWLPFLGQAMWALDFPFMRRHSREYLAKHPEARGADLETTRRKCERFRTTPTAILNFVEGTRYTDAKHAGQQSPFRHLLRPRAGGVGFVLGAMGDQLHRLVDVTIAYPDGPQSFWDFLCGRVRNVIVEIEHAPLPRELAGGDYERDDAFRLRIQEWITARWERKDRRLATLLATAASAAEAA